jgi:hypothetical protein
MKNNKTKDDIGIEIIKELIYIIRGRKVMMDEDLARLYEVPTKVLNQAVKRNIERFPEDFMFQLTKEEAYNLKSQFVTSSYGGRRKLPKAFTEQGIAMLSSVLNSSKAIQINIQIIRIFTKLREMIDSYKELREKVEEMEKNNETNFKEIFRVIRLLITQEQKTQTKIGFDIEASHKKGSN